MDRKSKCITVEQAKRLRELGIVQKAEYFISELLPVPQPFSQSSNPKEVAFNSMGFGYAAFDSDELMGMMPCGYNVYKTTTGHYFGDVGVFQKPTLAEFLADSLIAGIVEKEEDFSVEEINQRIEKGQAEERK